MNIFYLVLVFSTFNLSWCSLELSVGTFITGAISSNDFGKRVAAAFYWGKNVYKFIKDVRNKGETKASFWAKLCC